MPLHHVDVALAPSFAEPAGRTCLVVDVLRATSAIAVLLGRGTRAVYPAATVEEGLALRERLRAQGIEAALCGERDALPPPGYDYGNSPGAFIALDRVPEAAVVATTNGTPALLACASAPLTMTAAPLQAAAVVRAAIEAGRDILVVCSGLRREPAEDDTLAAGLFVERLVRLGASPGTEALFALERYEETRDDLAQALARTEHGQRLVGLGFEDDISLCGALDRYGVAGSLSMVGGRAVLRPMPGSPR
ncbi:MAG: 2-phosphosulfolactate phosphatase [Chloroflexi bacterium]|nr:2-phosphosulfolactate phosphatase [Chloroflexota bacterium]